MADNSNMWKVSGILLATFITVICTLSLFITAGIKSDIKDLDTKLFVHLTNHDIHIPREQIVTQKEFDMHCYAAEKTTERLLEKIVAKNARNQ